MVLILLSWLYIFFTSITVGLGFSKLFRISANSILSSIFGLFGITLLASFWAVFGAINVGFHVFLIIISTGSAFAFKVDVQKIYKEIRSQISAFSFSGKLLLVLISLLILMQSATLPFIIDNETYYIQTIKWLNEYGFVPGLANLHLFLGQTSGWHITQSVYSFSFLSDRFNDLNGYLLIIVNFWAFQKLHSYLLNGKKSDLIFGLLPVSYVFLFQFVSAPSPDLPIYLLAFLAFSIFLSACKNPEKETFSALVILILFAVYIKITAVVLLLLPLFLWRKNSISLQKQLVPAGFLSGITLLFFATKNAILTGYPLYPLHFWSINSKHSVPEEIMDYFFSREMMHSFYMGFGSHDTSVLGYMKQFFWHSGMDSIIGLGTLLLLFLIPFAVSKYYPKQGFGSIYSVFITSILLLVFSSPQYRFYVHFSIFFGLLMLSIIISHRKWIVSILGLSVFLTAFLVFVPTSFGLLTQNKSLGYNATFEFKNTMIPNKNSRKIGSQSSCQEGNLKYYSLHNYDFFWVTGNAFLPSLTQEQLEYFKTNFHIVPQMIGISFGEGFYAKKTNSND